MGRRKLVSALVAVAVLATSAAVGTAVATASPNDAPYVVTFKAGTDPDTIADQLKGQGRAVRKIFRKVIPGVAVDLSPNEVEALRESPVVERVEPDTVMTASDTRSGAIWGIDRTDQRSLPLSGTYVYRTSAGLGTYIYVLDTGVRATHVQLAGRVATGFTAFADGRGTADCHGHGTHVAGTAAGSTYGMANRATVVPVRVLDCAGTAYVSTVLAGLDYVVGDTTRRPAVANLSLGGPASATIDDAVSRAIAAGVTVVAAAGNETTDACTRSPARVPAALTVGSTNSSDTRSATSNYGTCVDLFAPGEGILSAYYTSDNATSTMAGTSMAAPHVAGAAAILLGENRTLSPAQVAASLVGNATPGKVVSAGTGSPNLLLYSDPGLPPANDAFASATTLTVSGSGAVNGSTLNATKESGEPNHAGNTGGGSAWYRFTLSSTSSVTLTTQGSGIDTLLGVYTGSAVGALTAVASNNDVVTGSTWSSVKFTATAGVTYRVAVDGVGGAKGATTLTWSVAPPVAVSTASVPGATKDTAYATQLAATGGSGPISWRLASGTLPAGVTLSSSGLLSGTPTTAGTAAFTVAVTDGVTTSSKLLSLPVALPSVVALSSATLPPGTVGTPYSASLSATGGSGSYSFALATGVFPSGLSLSSSGVVSGTPAAAGTFTFAVAVSDATTTVTERVSISLAPAVVVSTTSLPGGTTGVGYSAALAATGGTGTYTWSVVGGALPAGVSLSSTGSLTGTPSAAGTFPVTVQALDVDGRAGSKALSLTVVQGAVAALPATFTKTAPRSGVTGVSRSAATFSWTASSGATSYEICVAPGTASCGTGSTGWVPVGTATTTVRSGLASKTVYYWQVRAVNGSGATMADTGTWWTFTSAS